ncbi:MAG TPA: hypothetical protein VHW45_11605 [Candidatus Sulfotelmatobacter sp.]|nr:hypothetical protein [Candidatus Sulfotelmatobacter sp.]
MTRAIQSADFPQESFPWQKECPDFAAFDPIVDNRRTLVQNLQGKFKWADNQEAVTFLG